MNALKDGAYSAEAKKIMRLINGLNKISN
jgi:hypothetical protein